MAEFTNAEIADMHLAYGAADCNGRAAVRLYQERYPMRRVPNHQVFARLHRTLCETGSFQGSSHDRGRQRWIRTPDVEADVLGVVANTPSTSTRAVGHRLGVSHPTVWRVLQENQLHPFHLQRVQTLRPEDYPQRIAFARWFLQKSAAEPRFPACVLFTDEACFTREGVFNAHNAHVWVEENPHAVRTRAAQTRFTVNVWAGIVGDHLIGPYLMPLRLDGRKYRIFLAEVMPELLNEQHVPQSL